jgi:hypothetical protein
MFSGGMGAFARALPVAEEVLKRTDYLNMSV